MRRTGYTTRMLRKCIALIPELSHYPVMVRTHTSWYAHDLAIQFREMIITQLGSFIKSVHCEKQGCSFWVVVDDRAKFEFVAYEVSNRVSRVREYREIFDDNSVFELDIHDYD